MPGKTKEIKLHLSYAYQILAYLNLDDHTYTHISSRSEEGNSFYIYPFGLKFNEVTPNNLLKVSLDGKLIEGIESQYNTTGYIIHGSIYKDRNDIKSIFHLHTPEIVAVSSCKKGLIPLSQWALHFYNRISYHDYNSLSLDVRQGLKMIEDLRNNYTMLLKNHGSITCGKTIHEAMFYSYHLQKACETQCLTLAMNQELDIPSKEICERSVVDLLLFEKDLGIRDWHAWIRLIKNNLIHTIF
jgi:ribulose-5-phosphate 4-epimerase/fuculose-1-phosphate aldolase